MDILPLVILSLLPCLVIAAALSDLTTMRIPNWISGALIVGFFPAALAVGLPLETLGLNLGLGFAALVIGMGLFALRIIGGGDAKLMAAAVVWLGLPALFPFILWTAIAGGFFCAGLIAARGSLSAYAAGAPTWVSNLLQEKGDVPYGVAIAIGALLAFPSSVLLERFIAG
ncbi:MAG: prepilin peptidase [Pseudomonadota bacterium]